jgi:Ca2+-binding EF-hand superfamily protein
MDKGNVDECNYTDFCADIDGANQLFGVSQGFNHSYNYVPKTAARTSQAEVVRNNPDDIDDVLSRIRTLCKQQGIRISEFFRDFDRLRSGHITAGQFRIGLTMAKTPISQQEFNMLSEAFKAPKEGAHIKWREFSDRVDEVFTQKGLEKNLDAEVGAGRTTTVYGRREASDGEREICREVVDQFRELVRTNRLDAKSFFQDRDSLRHFKVSPKIFRQVLNTLGFQIDEAQTNAISLVYGEKDNSIRYADFLRDANCLEYVINGNTTGAKSTFRDRFTDFEGVGDHGPLMKKVKELVKKDRIRMLEFFQDHDTLRKGYLPAQKFRGVLHGQRIALTPAEYTRLENAFALSNDAGLINYVTFCDELDAIFTDKTLEKNPTRRPAAFNAPSILDPKDIIDADEEEILMACLARLGTDVKNRRLLIKPHF